MSDPFIGEIRMVGFDYAPYGWAFCNGGLMSIAQNQALFALLGTKYGGNGVSTFGLPDLRGRSPVGMGQGPGLAPIVQGEMDGLETVTLTAAQMPAHNHAVPASSSPVSVSGAVAVPVSTDSAVQASPANAVPAAGGSSSRPFPLYNASPSGNATLAPFDVTLSGSASAPATLTSVSGGSQPLGLRNPYLGVNFVIALQGVFPSRG